jgi:carbonic anhydrase
MRFWALSVASRLSIAMLQTSATTIVQNAWARKQHLCVHGWMYDISTGKLKDISCCVTGSDKIEEIYLIRK